MFKAVTNFQCILGHFKQRAASLNSRTACLAIAVRSSPWSSWSSLRALISSALVWAVIFIIPARCIESPGSVKEVEEFRVAKYSAIFGLFLGNFSAIYLAVGYTDKGSLRTFSTYLLSLKYVRGTKYGLSFKTSCEKFLEDFSKQITDIFTVYYILQSTKY